MLCCRCGHCKRLKPDFAKAAAILSKNDPPIILAKVSDFLRVVYLKSILSCLHSGEFPQVDCTEAGKTACNNHGVSGYPTLKIFRKGTFVKEYSGPRSAGEHVVHHNYVEIFDAPSLSNDEKY